MNSFATLLNAPMFLGAAPGGATVGEGVELMFAGMAIVFTALITIWTMVVVLGKLLIRNTPAAVVATPVAAPKPVAASPAPDSIDPEVLAVISATVAAVVGRSGRIRRINFISQVPSSAWAEHGRASIHHSHRLRKGPK